MIIEYHRPASLEEALSLLNRSRPSTVPLGGGLFINEQVDEDIAVVDIQDLNLNQIDFKGNRIQIGAGATLEEILAEKKLSPAVIKSIKHQETYNRRQVATLGGTLAASNGRSPIAAVFLALDAVLELRGEGTAAGEEFLGELLPLREEKLAGKLITRITIPAEAAACYHYVARSPADLPIVCAAAARWPSGRTRVVLGGTGAQPVMVLDGPDEEGARRAARDAYSAAEDHWASAEYRSHTAEVLVGRCLDDIHDE